MKLKIKTRKNNFELILLEKENAINSLKIDGKTKLSLDIIPKIDLILRRNKFRLNNLEEIVIDIDKKKNITSNRIIEVVKNVLDWSKNQEVNKNCG